MASAQGGSAGVTKYATDGFSLQLANVLEERLARIKQFVDEDKACTRDELSRFIWGTARSVRQTIKPEDPDTRRRDAWQAAKGMLKEIIDFDKFRPQQFNALCVKNVLEKKTAETIDNYRVYVLTGEIRTRWFPPKLLGETDEILCIDKPCLYTCTYGGSSDDPSVPPRAGAESASALLNGEKAEIQIHEYLALKFNYENAVGTREWWKKEEPQLSCTCGSCHYCAFTQSGCCNRLDKETSGVMICAKTKDGFGEIRRQFASEHSIEKGGTEKYYFALVHGEVKLPTQEDKRSNHWKHSEVEGRGRVEVTMKWSKEQHKSLAYDGGDGPSGPESPQWALTFYDPIAWFSDSKGREKYTLVHVQIITGRTHQIRFHLAEVGHSLVGDPTYGAPWADREWAKRVFLHSYQTKFREPFTLRWFEATSPLPPDLGQVLMLLKLVRVKEPWTRDAYLSRRQHPPLNKFMRQYDPMKPLLFSHDPPVSAQALQAAQGQMAAVAALGKGGVNGPQGKGKGKAKGKSTTTTISNGNNNNNNNNNHSHNNNSTSAGGNNGNSWDNSSWNSNGWNNDNWHQDSWQGGGWKDNAWQSNDKAPAKQAVAAGNDDDDDDWGGWSGGQSAGGQAEQPAQPPQQAQPSQQAQPPQPVQPAQPAQPAQPPLSQHPAAAPTALPVPPGVAEPVAKRLRLEVPANMANQAPATPPSSAPPQQAVKPGWRRLSSRSQAGVYYYFNDATGETMVEPPPPWEKRQSRSQPGVFYYFNPQTGTTSAEKPPV